MNKAVKNLLWIWMLSWVGVLALVYAFDPMKPDLHRLCSWLPEHASWDVSSWDKTTVWSYLWDLMDVVVPDWLNIWWALTPRTKEWKTLCTFTCDFWYKLDSNNQTCVVDPDVNPCPDGYSWNNTSKSCEKNSETYSDELVTAYNYAYELWIEDRAIEEAHLYEALTKQELAKIISIWAENELGRVENPDASCNFLDRVDTDGDYLEYVIQACKLWLMGTNNSYFDPYRPVTNAIFATTLSRALWWDMYDGWEPYYSHHIAALQSARIIGDDINPNTQVLKWYVYAMIYRAMYWENQMKNNMQGEVLFKKGVVSSKTVFDGVYTAPEDINLNWWMIIRNSSLSELFGENAATFNLILDWEVVSEITTNANVWRTALFDAVNLKKWETLAFEIRAEVDWSLANTGVYQYGVWFFDIVTSSGEQKTAALSPMVVVDPSIINISSNDENKEVISLDSGISLWEFVLTPESNFSSADIEEFSLEFDKSVDIDDLTISLDGTELDCENAWNNTAWHQVVKCEDLDETIDAYWSILKVKLRNPETWKYRITLSWINWSSDFYSLIKVVVDPSEEIEISPVDEDAAVILAENRITLWKFRVKSKNGGATAYLGKFLLEFDKSVNFDDLTISFDGSEIECENEWFNYIWHQVVICESVDEDIDDIWVTVEVKLSNPETWEYRTTLSWINWNNAFYSIKRLVVDPLFKLKFIENEGAKTAYLVKIDWNNNDSISNLRLYASLYDSADDIEWITPIASIPWTFADWEEIEIENKWENMVLVKTIAYDVDWETVVINKEDYKDYFNVDDKWNNLKIYPVGPWE